MVKVRSSRPPFRVLRTVISLACYSYNAVASRQVDQSREGRTLGRTLEAPTSKIKIGRASLSKQKGTAGNDYQAHHHGGGILDRQRTADFGLTFMKKSENEGLSLPVRAPHNA